MSINKDLKKMQKNLFIGILLFFISNQSYAVEYFEIKTSQRYPYDVDIHLYDADNHIGFVSYTKIFFIPFYIIHSLYVYPQYRKKGYGTKLSLHVCNIIKKLGAKRVYIQPGPFEIINNQTSDVGSLYQKKMQQLIKFYKKFGFSFVNPISAKLASILYYFMGIREDSHYLMVKKI